MGAKDPEIVTLHKAAEEGGESYYNDPATGRCVFTRKFLQQRGYCCISGCRHCPYIEDLEFFADAERHLVCKPYSIENLHRMAEWLRIKKCWYHGGDKPHYDIPKKRLTEILNHSRVTVMTARDIVRIITGK